MPTLEEIKTLDQPALAALRQKLLAQANGPVSNLPEDKLELLLAVYARLRNLTSGPPKEKKTRASKPALALDEIPG